MKRFILLAILFPVICVAQPGYINKVVGSGTSGFSGDGGQALAAQMGEAYGLGCDNFGNLFFVDINNSRVRKVNSAGIIITVAGGGNFTTDGVLATDANLINLRICDPIVTSNGDLYFVDGDRIRKVDHATSIITTVAGTTTAGFSGDGGAATSAQLNTPMGIYIDATGNLYIADAGNHCVRKVNTAGIINTYAGNGIAGDSGDGGPATLAMLDYPAGLCMDVAGNLYVADKWRYRIRKISASGIITTFAGVGISGFSGDGGPATSARFIQPTDVKIDGFGNVYIADFWGAVVRKVDPSGIITAFAGGGASLSDNVPATSESFTYTWGIGVDANNNIYIPDWDRYRICKVTGLPSVLTATSDSFSVYINSICEGPGITIAPAHYSASLSVKTFFGDGHSQVDTFSAYWGMAIFNHAYSYPGIYTIKHVLYDGALAVDSISSSYNYVLCKTMPLELYYDANANCLKDSTEIVISQSLLVEVDSNSVPIDTISTTSGIYYTAYGNSGDVYAFKVISAPVAFNVTCPVSGVVYDTLGALSIPTKYLGMQCNATNSFDLGLSPVVAGTGPHAQQATIYVQNEYCHPVNATVTLHYSPKYNVAPSSINPAAAMVAGNSIIWDLNGLSSTEVGPIALHYVLNANVNLTVGDTVHSNYEITPTAGDTDATNNTIIIYDTVKSSFDPNEIIVSPAGCIPSAVTPVQLTYTIHFENTGNDTAHNIYVLDTLPANVDVSTMRIVMSSHQMYVSKTKDAAGHNILKFDFPVINLLDSSHHGLCDGAVIFTINTKPGLATGSHVANRAGIYFDVNEVVMTNEVDNLIGCPTTIRNVAATTANPFVYPSPANDLITISADKQTYQSYTIINSVGQAVSSGTLIKDQTTVNISELAEGLYFVHIKGKNGNVVRKFLKM